MIWSDEEIPEFDHDDSWLLIANEAAVNRILKEQYGDIQYKRTTRRLPIQARAGLGLYAVYGRDDWRMQGKQIWMIDGFVDQVIWETIAGRSSVSVSQLNTQPVKPLLA